MFWLKNNWLVIAGILIGAIAGYFYWHQIGCVTATCAISSKPLNSTLYGALMGYLVFSIFKKENEKSKDSPPA